MPQRSDTSATRVGRFNRTPHLDSVYAGTTTDFIVAWDNIANPAQTFTVQAEVTIELGDIGTQTVLVTQKLDYKVTVP